MKLFKNKRYEVIIKLEKFEIILEDLSIKVDDKWRYIIKIMLML